MVAHSRVHEKDEELGKRGDEFIPKRSLTAATLVQPWRWRRRRHFLAFFLTAILVYFARTVWLKPYFDGPALDSRLPNPNSRVPGPTTEPAGAPPKAPWSKEDEAQNYYYNGVIKFYRLASSLHSLASTSGMSMDNRNILFAAGSLRSAANLLPMACEMARWDRNYVHVALLGRNDLSLDDVLEINGVRREHCRVFFHDGRPDYSAYSTDRRAEVAVGAAMKHIWDFMHPQALIVDDSSVEDGYFTRAMRFEAEKFRRPLIEIPAGHYEEWLWITRLDAASLNNWLRPTIDILIHSPSDSSGGLIRLVRSLAQAEYAGLRIPKLLIEMPLSAAPSLRRYLEILRWPPIVGSRPQRESTLSLRHRINSAHLSSEQASIRFLESFYPTRVSDHHILVLSAGAEVTPVYLQYLYYAVLRYRYSSRALSEATDLLGIALDVPTTFLNGSSGFKPPTLANMNTARYYDSKVYDQTSSTAFWYQAPSANALLIFGDRWASLHNFLTDRLAAVHLGNAEKKKKFVAETEPSWLEFLLELMRARGWKVLHPSLSFVTVHNELSQIPEEFVREPLETPKSPETNKQAELSDEEPFLLEPDPPALVEHEEGETEAYQPLHDLLPFDGELLDATQLPHLTYRGTFMNPQDNQPQAEEYATDFRQRIGGCDATHSKNRRRVFWDPTFVDDLFCLPGMEWELEDDVVEEDHLAAPAGGASTIQRMNKAAMQPEALVALAETTSSTSIPTPSLAQGVVVETDTG